ncbi:MAG: tetratricopeptide repeat protein [Planctomycetota bacterium]|jgi:tetratricopeptide (TPR) repeat protein
MIDDIEKAIEKQDWKKARQLLRNALKRKPDNHWLLNRLGLTYYEQLEYKRAIHYIEKALAIAPRCPLALWDYAHCLDMTGKMKEAIATYRKIVKLGVERIAHGDCGQGKGWARGLIADCHLRMAYCYKDLRQLKMAVKVLKRHLKLRGPGCRSIYNIEDVRKLLHRLVYEPQFA